MTNYAAASAHAMPECWICYDSERKDVGSLIQPCACKGDVSAVHHDCLKKWLMDSYSNPDNVKCKVCDELYQIQRGQVWLHNDSLSAITSSLQQSFPSCVRPLLVPS